MNARPVISARCLVAQLRVSRRRRDARADRGGAQVDFVQQLPPLADALHFLADRVRVAVEFLAERHRHRVLEVRAAHLEHVIEFLRLRANALRSARQRLELGSSAQDQRELERRRIGVVRRLPEVDVVVRVEVLVLALRWPRISSATLAITSFAFMFVDVRRRPG